MGELTIVVGGQFGSEGKGAIAAHLIKRGKYDFACRVAGPNAGHTVYDEHGTKYALQQIPVAAAVDNECDLIIAAGSEIDPEILEREKNQLRDGGHPVDARLFVDPTATVIEQADADEERAGLEHGQGGLTARIGSTGKGVGKARARRVMREAEVWGSGVPTGRLMGNLLEQGGRGMIEGTQGYGLGLHTPYYPYTTSSDCRAIDFCAMAGVSPWLHSVAVVVVMRTYPIRVAGNSGPLHNETSWERLSDESGGYIQPEYTTVTKKQRRIGSWDSRLAKAAVQDNGGGGAVAVALTFVDYWWPELAGATGCADHVLSDEQEQHICLLERQIGAPILWLGTGPRSVLERKVS